MGKIEGFTIIVAVQMLASFVELEIVFVLSETYRRTIAYPDESLHEILP